MRFVRLRSVSPVAGIVGPFVVVMLCGAPASAQQRIVIEPPAANVLRVQPRTGMPAPMAAAAPAGGPVGEAFIDLAIRLTSAKIYNPATDRQDAVELRSYRDVRETATPPVPFVAPTIEVFPGDTVRISLNNRLAAEPGCEKPDVNEPSCFNRTNLHAHGLFVSPAGNSDNVLLSINPNVSFQYEYNLPLDHPAGTYWYHPHRHGSTALQVASGMAGALIVRGTRLPTPQLPGDIDTLLKDSSNAPYRERIVLLQQVQYACRDAAGAIKTEKNAAGQVVGWICDPSDVGRIDNYDQFAQPNYWKQSGRYTSINGEVLPQFTGAQAGRIERWRIIHAGVRDTVKLQFKKMREGAEPYAKLTEPQQQDWLTRNCPGVAQLPQFAIAADGLTRSRIIERTTSTLQPGYREDLLMVFPEPGEYCLIDEAAEPQGAVNNQVKSRRYLGRITVAPGTQVSDARAHIRDELLAAATRLMPSDVREQVRNDLASDLQLTSFVPHTSLGNPTIPEQEVRFDLNFTSGLRGHINGKPYNPNDYWVKPLGAIQDWKLTSEFAGHPFHIHVNPFQILSIIDNTTKQDVSVDGASDPQYANLKGVWKDTLFVRPDHTIYVRTQYRRYIGDFVIHCHILDHEDAGMMQNIRIALPDGTGGTAPHHH